MVDFGSSFLGGLTGGATVAIVIKGIDQFSGTFNSASKGISGLGRVAKVGLAGVAALGVGLTALGTSSVSAALKFQPIEKGFQRLAKDSDNFLKSLNEATKGTVSNFQIMSSANNALLLGLDQDALPSLFKNAAIVGRAAGRTTTEAINDITVGIGRQSRLILDNLGIIVKAEEAYESYALSIGKAASELTVAEQRTAFTTAAITALEEKASSLGGVLEEDATTSLQQMNKQIEDLKVEIGTALLPVISELAQRFVKEVLPAIRPMIPTIIELFKTILDVGQTAFPILITALRVLNPLLKALQFTLEAIRQLFTDVANGARFLTNKLSNLPGGNARRRVPSFQQGGMVPSTGLAFLHKGERVVPAGRAAFGTGGGIVINIGNVVGLDAEDVSRSLKEELGAKLTI